jgi:predicted branched-subunit amino acid permease
MGLGLVVGAAAARQGLSFFQSLAMKFFVCSVALLAAVIGPLSDECRMAGWLAAAGVGYFVGGLIVDPARYGLDLVMPAFFAAMLVPLWAGARRASGWMVAGIVAVIVKRLVQGWWFIIAGSITGADAGGCFDERSE